MPAKILNGRPMQAGRDFHGNVDEAGSDAKPAMSISPEPRSSRAPLKPQGRSNRGGIQ